MHICKHRERAKKKKERNWDGGKKREGEKENIRGGDKKKPQDKYKVQDEESSEEEI